MTEKITLRLVNYGERTVTVDRGEYETAKEADRLARFLDMEASDMDTGTTVVEPDGHRFDLYGGNPVYDADELLESASGLIANAGEGSWDREHPEWRDAAERWRDRYHAWTDASEAAG